MTAQSVPRVRIPFVEHLGIRLTEQSKERASIVLDKRPELLNSWGAAHGGVVMTMLDFDMSVGFMNAGTSTHILAEGRVLHGGQSTAFCEAEARDEGGKLLAKAIGTFKLLGERK